MFGQQFLKILVLTAGIIALASGFQLIFASPNEPLTSKPELSVKEKQKAFNKICGAIASSDYFSGAVLGRQQSGDLPESIWPRKSRVGNTKLN